MTEPHITIAICTYNRSKYLKLCLDSIYRQLKPEHPIEVLVVDNNSVDTTKQVCEAYKNKGFPLRYVFEGRQGISFARNSSFENSNAYWIAYLDDDGIPHDDYIERLLWVCNHFECDCFGGMYYAYYEGDKPKWLPDSFGTKKKMSTHISLVEDGFLSAGIFVCKREALLAVDGFSIDLGPIGKKMGYAEEDYLQHKLRTSGYTIAFDPKLAIDHLVTPPKLKPTWHIKHTYHLYRDMVMKEKKYKDFNSLFKQLVSLTFKHTPRTLWKFIKTKEYYWQNLYIDVMGSYAKTFGYYNNRQFWDKT